MASGLLKRVWDGPFEGLLPTMGILKRGEEYLVTEQDALSAHWLEPEQEPEKPAVKPAKTAEPATEVNA